MSSTEILEWVMGWPWPVILVFAMLMAGGIARIISWDSKNPSEYQASGQVQDKKCVCECE